MSNLRNIMEEIAKGRAVKQIRGDTELGGEGSPFEGMLPQEPRRVGRPPIARGDIAERATPRTGPAERVAEMAERREQPAVPFEPGTPTQARRQMEEQARQFDVGLGEETRQFDLRHALDRERFELERDLQTMMGTGTGAIPGLGMEGLMGLPGDHELTRGAADDIVRTALEEKGAESLHEIRQSPFYEAALDAGMSATDVDRALQRAYDEIAPNKIFSKAYEAVRPHLPGRARDGLHRELAQRIEPEQVVRWAMTDDEARDTIRSLSRSLDSENPLRKLVEEEEKRIEEERREF